MKKIIYHGSEKIIGKPLYGFGTSQNDYGRGFYCTENKELAKEWACGKNINGFANIYELDFAELKTFNLNGDDYHILNWLGLLTKYRIYWQKASVAEAAKKYIQERFLPEIDEYDIIIGYRADDSYFSFAQDFVMGTISLEQLSKAMRLGNLGEQIVMKSEKAFSKLKYIGNEEAYAEEYFTKKVARDRAARKDYIKEKEKADILNETFILDIMRGEMKDDEIRIRSGIPTVSSESTW